MRQQTCTTVTLRQRPIRNGRISLYLDYYPAVRNPKTMKLSRREYLGFYIYATPKNAIELDYNNEILAKAELIRCRRRIWIYGQTQNESRLYGIFQRSMP